MMTESKESRTAARGALAASVLFMVLASTACAMIDPDFTPIHVAQQADMILLLEFKEAPDKDGKVRAVVKDALKGKAPADTLTLDLMAGAFPKQGEDIVGTIAGGAKEAMFFVGSFHESGPEAPSGEADQARGFLHVGGKWAEFSGRKDAWDMVKVVPRMQATWSGGTDMLLRAIRYVLEDSDADVPCVTVHKWGKPLRIGKVDGRVTAIQSVDPAGNGTPLLYVASDRGDRLVSFQGNAAADVTAKVKLTAKSVASLWAPAASGGRVDLISLDGRALTLHKQQDDGSFLPTPLDIGESLVEGRRGLCLAGAGKDGLLVISWGLLDEGWPVLLTISRGSKVSSAALGQGEFPGKDMGKGGECFVADLDGDGIPDLLQLLPSGGLFHKGKAVGEFLPPSRTSAALGKGAAAACLGDYDADGLLDVFVAAEDGCRLWHNRGGGKFVETLTSSGEIGYISKGGGVWAATGDVNNDGRQAILIAYANAGPQMFFNRGFRSFGHARDLDPADPALLADAAGGQQAAWLGDLDGNGAQDLVLALRNGDLWLLPCDAGKKRPLSVSVAAPKGEAGPITLVGKRRNRNLGAWNLTAGGSPAFFGLPEAGPLTLTWKSADGRDHQQEIVVVDRPARVVLGAGK